MIKFQCDNVTEFETFVASIVDAKVDSANAQSQLADASDKRWLAEDRANHLSNEVERLQKQLAGDILPNRDRQLKELISAASKAQKIDGIKVIREMTGYGLKEAKDLYEDGEKIPTSSW